MKRLVQILLYPDNHAVAFYQERHEASGKDNQWVEIFERWIQSGSFERPPEKVLSIDGPLAKVIAKAKFVKVWNDNSSPASREKGLIVQTIEITTKVGVVSVSNVVWHDPLFENHINNGDLVVSSDWRFSKGQSVVTFAQNVGRPMWGDLKVAKIHRLEKERVS